VDRVTIDAAFSNQLRTVTTVAELCDPSGRVLGQFIPTADPVEWEIVGPEFSEEELERAEQSTEWYTTEEVLEHLRNLEGS
jgi:hypothetical protein